MQRVPRQISRIAGTTFEGTKTNPAHLNDGPAFVDLDQDQHAALELMRPPGINYESAWQMKHEIMQVMAE